MRARDAWLRQGALLASACALMLAVGLAASVAAPRPVTLEVEREVGPGAYKVPFKDANGARKALVFTVPAGIRIEAQGVNGGGSCITGFCPPPGMLFEGEGETGDDKGFTFCLDFETGAECGRGYPIARRAGDQTDQYGDPPGASASRAARAAKYGSLLDQIVASSHIEGAERDAPMSISPDGTPAGPGTYEIDGVVFNVPDGARISIPYIEVPDCPEEYWCGPMIVIDDENSDSWMALEIDTGVENYRIILPEGDAGARANALFDHIANSARLDDPVAAQRGGATGCTEATLGGSRAGNAALAVDCDALLAARHMLAGDGALNWSAGTPLSEWDGVTIAGAPPRVVGLDLRARGLGGAIPPQLGELTALTSLDLSDNTLTGAIPTQLGALTKLTRLDLSNNKLSGELPTVLDDLESLGRVRLARNAFTGCAPAELWRITTHDLDTLGLPNCKPPLTYGAPSWTGIVDAPGEHAFFTNSGPALTYEGLRNDVVQVVIHKQDAGGTLRDAIYDDVEAGDDFEWREASDCWVRYLVERVLPDPTDVPLKVLAVKRYGYAYTGCSGMVSLTGSRTLTWIPPNIQFEHSPSSISTPVRHGPWLLVPLEHWGGESLEEQVRHPLGQPQSKGGTRPDSRVVPEIARTVTSDISVARTLPLWHEVTLPANWRFVRAESGTHNSPLYGYTAYYSNERNYSSVEISIWYRAFRPDYNAPYHGNSGIIFETRMIDGYPALVMYSPKGPRHHQTISTMVRIFNTEAGIEYWVLGNDSILIGSNVDSTIEIARSLYLNEGDE